MSTVILGVAGFIGSNLARRLIGLGQRVIGVDNLETGSMENINPLLSSPLFEFHKADICSWFPLGEERVEVVYNLASPASPARYMDNPIPTMESNTIGVLNVLNWATEHKPIVIYSSTSEIYGNPEHPIQSEEMLGRLPLMSPRACYDYSKKFAEVAHYQYRRTEGLDTRVVRLFNTYGPNMNSEDGRVIASFLYAAEQGVELTVHGDGTQSRSFMYIDDLVDALLLCADKHRSWEGALNIGNPQQLTINQLTEMVKDMYRLVNPSRQIEVRYKEAYPHDPQCREPEINKVQEVLGWQPRTDLLSGLERTRSWVAEDIQRLAKEELTV